MNSGRFFVTIVLIFGMAGFVSCTPKKDKRTVQVEEGNRQIQTAARAQADLNTKFKISLDDESGVSWSSMTRDARQQAREKLAEFVSAVSRVLEIDAKKGIYLTKKDVLQRQLHKAMTLQKTLDQFEG